MMEKARWSGQRMGDQILAGRRGIAEGIVANHLSALSSAVAKGEAPEAAYQRASDDLRAAIARFNAQIEWQVRRDLECGQDTLRFAFWQLLDAWKREQKISADPLTSTADGGLVTNPSDAEKKGATGAE